MAVDDTHTGEELQQTVSGQGPGIYGKHNEYPSIDY
jgi:hypothetical protein